MVRQAFAGFLLLAATVPPVVADDTVQYGPPAAWVQPVTQPSVTKSATDAPAHSLAKNFQIRITPTATETYSESYIHIGTPQGLQALGNIVLPWKPDTDVLTVHRFRLLRGTEEIDILGKGQKFEVIRRENNLEYAALDGILSAALQPNGMEVGDVLDVAFTLRREFTLIPVPELSLGAFVESPPAERIEMRVLWDKSMPIKWRGTDVTGAKETRKGNEVELRWTGNDIGPIDQPNDVPARFWHEPFFEFSNYKSWNDLSQQLSPLYEKASTLATGSPLRAEVGKIAAASADTEKRLEAVLRLSQERVRYVFLGMADGNYRPANADETWDRRFGDCKGKTALIVAMLRELGIAAEPVAVNTRVGDLVPKRLPALAAFDHVIVRAQAGGKTYWLDGAGQGSWRRDDMRTPGYLWGLPLTPRGEPLLAMQAESRTTPLSTTEIEIDAREGIHTDAPFKATQTMRGPQAALIHSQVTQLAPALREQALKKFWKNEFDFVEPKTVREEFDADTGVLSFFVEGTAQMDWGGDSYTTDKMRTGSNATYKRESTVNQDAPFVVAHPVYSQIREKIQLPSKGEFTLKGKNYDASLAGYRYVRQAKLENGVFTGEASFTSLAHEVDAAAARAARKTLNDMWSDRLDIVMANYRPTDADIAALGKRTYDDRKNLVWRGNLYLDHGNYESALADFEAAAKLEPDNVTVLANRGIARYWLRRYDEARADFDVALKKEPRNAIALRGLGAVELSERKTTAAIELLSKSLDAEPGNTFALERRAYAYETTDDDAKSLADAAEAIRIWPPFTDMYALRARILFEQGRADEAVNELVAMGKARPDDEYTNWILASHYSRFGRFAEAVSAMDKYVAANPDDVEAYYSRATLRDPADTAGRLADVKLALAKSPKDSRFLPLYAELLATTGDHEGAIATYTAQLRNANAGLKSQLLIQRGIEYWKVGRQAEARRDFAAVLADQPDSDSYNAHCWELAMADIELQSALASCDKALKVAPKDPRYFDSRALALMRLGRLDESVAMYDAALALAPKQVTALYGRGLAKNRRCNCADGKADIDQARRLYPGVGHEFEQAGLRP